MTEQNIYKYCRLTQTVIDKGILVENEKYLDYINNYNIDWYKSLFLYTDEHLKLFNEKGTVSGLNDVKTNELLFDLDSKNDIETSRQDSIKLINKLLQYGVSIKSIVIYFSGNKGFHISLFLNEYLTPNECYKIGNALFKEIHSIDTKIYNASRIIRVPLTKHQKTNLYKIPLTFNQLKNLTIDEIKDLAKSNDWINNINEEEYEYEVISLPNEIKKIYNNENNKNININTNLDTNIETNISTTNNYEKFKIIKNEILSSKPYEWVNYKWLLLNGLFDIGERHNAYLTLASTLKSIGYDKELTRSILLGVDKKHIELTKDKPVDEYELETQILNSVFSDRWNGGVCTHNSEGTIGNWLKEYINKLDIKIKQDNNLCFNISDMKSAFLNYALNFEKNIIKTGIETLDKNCIFLCSTHNGILGQPGSGKTSLALEILRNNSKQGIKSMFFSLDVGLPIVYGKLIQKIKHIDFDEAIKLFKTDSNIIQEVEDKLKEEYSNVYFNFNAGITVQDMEQIINKQEEIIGDKIKLVIIDYLECIQGQYADITANMGMISNQLKDLANKKNLCSIVLLQTQKHATENISDPLLSMKQIKGSSVIEQASSVVLTLWREGYSPDTQDDDKFISFAVVKNRFGKLWRGDFGWNGQTGEIYELNSTQRLKLEDLRRIKLRIKEETLNNIKYNDFQNYL